MHRSAIGPRHDLPFRGAGLIDRALGREQQIGVELCIQHLRSADQRRHQLDRRKLLLLDQPRRLGDRQKRELVRHCILRVP